MSMWSRVQRTLRRLFFGPGFEEGITKALPAKTSKLVDRTGLAERGLHESPLRRVVEPGGKGPRKEVGLPAATLRMLARTNPWTRAAIDIRKREIANAKWDVVPNLERFEKELIDLRRLVQSVRRFPDRKGHLDRYKPNYITPSMAREVIEATRSPDLSTPEVRYRFSLALTDRYRDAERHATKVRPLFERPNRNPYGWSHILQATVPDLFILDSMCVEKRRSAFPLADPQDPEGWPRWDNPVVELHWVDGATVRPILNKFGMFPGVENPEENEIAFEQWIDNKRVQPGGWRFHDLAYIQENPQTDIEFRGHGWSRMESLVMSSILEAYGDRENLEEFKRSTYGGFLVLQKEGIDQEDIEDERRFIEEELEGTKKLPLIGISPDGKVSWVSTSPYGGMRDKKSVEAAIRLVKRIAATFEMPLIKLAEHTAHTNFATSRTTQKQDDDGLRNVLAFLDDAFTRNLVAPFGYEDIAYESDPQHMRDEKERLELAQKRLEVGIWELNDARMEWGEDPQEDGDISWYRWTEREKAHGQMEGQMAVQAEMPEDPMAGAEGEDIANSPGDGTEGELGMPTEDLGTEDELGLETGLETELEEEEIPL